MAKKKSNKYNNFMEINNLFCAVETPTNRVPKLPQGVYDLKVDTQSGVIYYSMIDTNHDAILDLPSPEYALVVRQIENFLTPACKARFKEKEYLYKRSILLHGRPGTGKTCIVNRIVDMVIAQGGVVLFNPNPEPLVSALGQLQDIQPETPVVVIFEELDKLMQQHEGDLLNILDGEVQRENVIFLATTNFFGQIPPRIKRPGRFGKSIEVGFPDASVRKFYLEHKMGPKYPGLARWVDETEGFSIDELSASVREVYCLQEKLDDVIKYMRELKKQVGGDTRESSNPYDKDDNGYIDMDELKKSMEAYAKSKRHRSG